MTSKTRGVERDEAQPYETARRLLTALGIALLIGHTLHIIQADSVSVSFLVFVAILKLSSFQYHLKP